MSEQQAPLVSERDLLKQTGYAVKPISGRCGSNIDLISAQDELLDKSSGKKAPAGYSLWGLFVTALPRPAARWFSIR